MLLLMYHLEEEERRDAQGIRKFQEARQRYEISEAQMNEWIDTIMDNARLRFLQLMDSKATTSYQMYKWNQAS